MRRRSLTLVVVAVVLVAVAVALYASRAEPPPPRPVANDAFASVRGDRAILWAVGDGADGGAAARALAGTLERTGLDRLLYLGDVYPDGTRLDFTRGFAPVYGRLAGRTAPTPGNHEWPEHLVGYDPYWRSVTGAPTPPWYAIHAGGWEVLALNSEAPHEAGSAQLGWLRGRLRRPTTCRLAFWHRPRFSAGSHGDQEDVAPLWEALRGRAALVVSGHDHNLQRLHPRDGLVQVVSGAGGHGHYDLDADDPRLAFGDDRHDGALRIELRPGRAELAFVTAAGRVLDRSAVRCRGAAGG